MGGQRNLGARFFRLKRQVMRLKPEVKFINISRSAVNIPKALTAWNNTTCLLSAQGFVAPITQGSGVSDRIGDKIRVRSIVITGTVTMPTQSGKSVADVAPSVHLALVRKIHANGAVVDGAEVYANPLGSADGMTAPLRTKQYMQDYNVMHELTFAMPLPPLANDAATTGNIVQAGVHIPFKIVKTFPQGLVVKYKANTGAATDMETNQIDIIGAQSSSNHQLTISYNARTQYTDV